MPKPKPLKIGFVVDDGLDSTDGVQQYVLTLGAWLRSQGHDVHYLVGQTERIDIPNIHSLTKNLPLKFNGNRVSTPLLSSKKQITQLLQSEQFDVLHVQMPYSPLFGSKVVEQAPAATALVGTFHILPLTKAHHGANKLLGKVLRPTLKKFARVVSVSSAAQAFAKKAYGLTSDVVPCLIDTAHFRAGRPLPEFADSKTILFLGRLVPRKGCKELLQAINYLRQHNPEALAGTQVVICGRGQQEAKLKKYAVDNNLADIVTFKGFISEAEKADYLASADIAVFPSLSGESFGIVLLEAMAAGADVVLGGNNPGYSTVLGERPELLLDPRDTVAFAGKLAVLLGNPVERQALHAWQAQTIGQYDTAVVGNRFLQIYAAAIAKRGGATHNT